MYSPNPNYQTNIYGSNPQYQQNVIQQPQFQHQPPQFQTEEPEEDVVPETQEESSRKRNGKGKTKDAQTKVIPWKEDGHLALADAWCTTSKKQD